MTRLDVLMDARMKREREGTLLAVYGGLIGGVERAGGQLLRLSVVLAEGDCLMVLKAEFPAGVMVGFVGAEDLPSVLRKGAALAVRDKVVWREDKWRDNGG